MVCIKKSRIDYYEPRPPLDLHMRVTYSTNVQVLEQYARQHLVRDVGKFFKPVVYSVLWESAHEFGIGSHTLPAIPAVYQKMISNLARAPDRECLTGIQWSYDILPSTTKPNRSFMYIRDRECGWTR